MLLVESRAVVDLSLKFLEAFGEFIKLVLIFFLCVNLGFELLGFGSSSPRRDVNLGDGFHGVHSKAVFLLLLLREQCGVLAN